MLGLTTVSITYSVTVNSGLTGDELLDGTVSSTSRPTSNNCILGSTDPRCANTVPVAALGIQQSASETTATPGSIVSVAATYANTGQVPYRGISIATPNHDVNDDVSPIGDETATSGALVRTSTAITWTGDIPVGVTITVLRTLRVKDPDPGNKLITATVWSAAPGSNCPQGGSDPTCTFLVTVLIPELTITKTANAPATVPGGQVGYTIEVHNTGQTDATGVSVSDSLNGVIDDAAYDGNAMATSGIVSFSSPTLTWTGDLAVDGAATITYSITASRPATGDKTLVNQVTSSAVGSTCPPSSGNVACRTTGIVLTPALTVTTTASVASTVPGANVTYTVTATNTGQTFYSAAQLSVPLGGVLDDATYGGGASATSGVLGVAGELLEWTGDVGYGATVTITYTVVVDQPVTGDFRLIQTVSSPDEGSTCPPSGTGAPCTTSVASLQILNTADVATTTPTSVVRNTVTFTNAGQVPYVGISLSDSFVGSLDDATYNGDAEASAGSLILVTGTGRVTWTGDLPVGATVTVTGSLTVNNPDLGNRIMTTLVTTSAEGSSCPIAAPAPSCRTSVLVQLPALTITKVANTFATAPGGDVRYTITVTNSGETAYTGATVRDSLAGVLADASYRADATASSGAVTFTEPTLTWTGNLALGQVVVISYSVRVNDPDLGGKIMVNDVTSDVLGSSCPSGGASPACSTFVVVLVPVLDLAVVADRTTTVPGGTVGYTVTVRNTGQTSYVGATVTALLAGVVDDATYAGGAVSTTGAVTLSGSNLSWTGDLAQGATAVITYAVTVADPDVGNRLLSTSVASPAPGSTCGGESGCDNIVTVLIPGLAVSASADASTATPGDQVELTITVANTGQTPYVDIVVGTTLSDVLDDATFDGLVSASSGVATYTDPDLSWTGSLPVGASATISVQVTIRDPDLGDKVLAMTAIAPAPGSTCQAASADPACTTTVTVLVPSLTISKSVGSGTTTPGAVVAYTIIVTNSGQTAYQGAVVEDSLLGVLPDADYNGDAAVSGGGTLAFIGSTLTWTGDVLIGASATITYSITVHDPDTGDKQMTNTVTSAEPGSSCPPGEARPACATFVRVLVPALVITKSADVSAVAASGAVRYTVTLVNSGETGFVPATFTDPLADVLDDAGYEGDAAASAGTVEYVNGSLVWTGALAVGATVTVTYSVTTLFPASGDLTLANTVFSASAGGNCVTGTDPRCRTTVTVLVPALTIVKHAGASDVVAGGDLRYTISATNTGQSDYPVAVLTDSLAGVLDDAEYHDDAVADTGSLAYDGDTLSWSGALPAEATVTITYSVTADIAESGDAVLTNRVESTSVGSTCPPAGLDPGCTTATAVAARSVALSDLTPSFSLNGPPNSTASADGAVTMTVVTNSTSGYLVTVQAATASLSASEPTNPASIPVDQLQVRESGTSTFQAMSADSATVVHQQGAASAPAGDAVSNDFQVQIPFVPPDTYSTTLDYIVSAP
jgi:uncharacterized repeat protein (TIGR01451 family)